MNDIFYNGVYKLKTFFRERMHNFKGLLSISVNK